ncbi:DUF4282 domain-containing protein [Glutamicibacter endophyticus]|uniref:DUF4282 domain-containing protein n=1 Tax=Glutamicibacter endophyticus TaxID=1522174 RepID=UPI003AEF7504
MKALFDLDFRKFITPTIIKIVYVLIMVMLALTYIVFVFGAFNANVAFGFLTLLILGPLFVLVYLVLARAGLESLIAQIRTAENTTEMVRLMGGIPPAEAAHNYYPSTPQPPAGQQPEADTPSTPPTNERKNDEGPTPPTNPYQP